MKMFLVKGVPASVQMDGWWITHNTNDTRPAATEYPVENGHVQNSVALMGPFFSVVVLVGLLALADILVWQAVGGLSLVVFGMAVVTSAYFVAGQKGIGGIAAAAVFMVPVLEYVQFLSVMFWGAGLVLGAAWVGLSAWPGGKRWLVAGGRFLHHGPLQSIADLRTGSQRKGEGFNLCAFLIGWAMPIGLGAVFVALLLEANPMIEGWFSALLDLRWFSMFSPDRVMFWAIAAPLIWPFLALSRLRERLKLPFKPRPTSTSSSAMINAQAVFRSLVLFNVVFAVQTGMDALYLWGSVTLPEGMSYATYAHRGAYPLVAMALLAGAFAVMIRPLVAKNPVFKMLLLVWIGQTVILVFSSLFRLEVYIDALGLTRLRLAALIWMGVVALGLGLLIWQVIRDHPTRWLMVRVALLGCATLYLACFLSFDREIAHYNLANDARPDAYYICGLGSSILPEIRAYEQKTQQKFCRSWEPSAPQFWDWREWGFRQWRVQRTLAAMTPMTPSDRQK